MFKKHVLAIAVMAMTSGVAFAENEAIISQVNDPATSTATVEQVYVDGNTNYGQIIQDATTSDGVIFNAVVYQGISSDVGAVDPTAPTAVNVLGTSIDLALAAWVDAGPVAYAPLTATVANFAYVKQDTTDASRAMIVQTSVDDASLFASANTLFANDLIQSNVTLALDVGLSDGGGLSDGTNDLIAAGVPSAIFLANVDDTAANVGNIAAISQGSEVVDRDGNVLGGAQNDGGIDEAAIIVQLGSDNIAQILQAGDTQFAAIIQADIGNDAFVAQYSGTTNTATIVQVAINDLATVYQSGDGNVATINQYQPF
ncbi:MAG: hypothetical protein Q7S87_06485 [Agitococcus sp.]|nr:hypothetical protein [Agitococcus sp.]